MVVYGCFNVRVLLCVAVIMKLSEYVMNCVCLGGVGVSTVYVLKIVSKRTFP